MGPSIGGRGLYLGMHDRSRYPVRRNPLTDLSIHDLTTPGTVFQIGTVPCRVDLLTTISGVVFDQAWTRRLRIDIEGIEVPVLGRSDFVANKKAIGRPRDRSDLDLLGE